ncbi:hypothetical protein [Rubritalea tangerina]|uniref:hypothetical protein n=1 Tax=Rubritalea tangerina TaxID=430798 RepID=UPI003620F10E
MLACYSPIACSNSVPSHALPIIDRHHSLIPASPNKRLTSSTFSNSRCLHCTGTLSSSYHPFRSTLTTQHQL